jgi:hypothetical protein
MEGGVSLFDWKLDHDWVISLEDSATGFEQRIQEEEVGRNQILCWFQRTKIGQVSDARWSCWNQLT